MLRRSPAPVSLSIMRHRSFARVVALLSVLRIGIAAVASAASDIHIVQAAAAPSCSFPPCLEDHREGHFAVGGAGSDLASIDSVADSAYGIMNIQIGYRWLEGASPPSTFTTEGDTLEEGVVLSRIAPGPVAVRATLDLDDTVGISGAGALIELSSHLSFDCGGASMSQFFSGSGSLDPNPMATGCAEATAGLLTIDASYDGDLPTNPVLYATLLVDLQQLHKGDEVSLSMNGTLQLGLINATADWKTPSFLTLAPEPEDDALALVAIGAIAAVGARRRATR